MRPVPRGPGSPSQRLLLVDDEAAVRQVLGLQLSRFGFSVAAAASGADALAIADTGLPLDGLITDLSMPGMTGVALIEAIHQRRPGLPAILLTGYAEADIGLAIDGATRGAYSLLRKPVTGDHLAERMRALMATDPVTPAA